MSVCGWCNLEMTSPETRTCPANIEIEFEGGVVLPAIPHVPGRLLTREEWMASWRASRAELDRTAGMPLDSIEEAQERCEHYLKNWDRCYDCGVGHGGNHHPGCDNEQCPQCGGQLIGCDYLHSGEGDDQGEAE